MKPALPKKDPARILVVDPDPDVAASIQMLLRSLHQGHHISLTHHGQDALTLASREHFDLILTNFRLPGLGGLELLKQLHSQKPQRPVVLMSANANLAIEATKQGAYDFLVKPFDAEQLLEISTKALQASSTMSQRITLGSSGSKKNEPQLLGSCPEMQKIYKEIGRFAPTDVTVLILGETGTGKELVARAIYQHSERAHQPFVAVNCGAIPENLLESELFGHVRGAFTGAPSNRIGRFQQAHQGTLFLDEIGDLLLPVQVKLLRVLQEGTFQPLGSTTDIHVDVRVLAATHQPLVELISQGQFREDLYYRINSATIDLPPLRNRGKDLETLLSHFADIASEQYGIPRPKFPAPILKRLLAHPWPGNARELNNVITQLVVRSRGFPLTLDLVETALSGTRLDSPHLSNDENEFALAIIAPVRAALEDAKNRGSGDVHDELVRDLEKQLISTALELAGGHLGNVSSWLGISRVTLRKKIAVYHLASPK
ncbi:MAG: sigma-54 dependent transcriptional regulator [Verrucomicrobiota bacterium]